MKCQYSTAGGSSLCLYCGKTKESHNHDLECNMVGCVSTGGLGEAKLWPSSFNIAESRPEKPIEPEKLKETPTTYTHYQWRWVFVQIFKLSVVAGAFVVTTECLKDIWDTTLNISKEKRLDSEAIWKSDSAKQARKWNGPR